MIPEVQLVRSFCRTAVEQRQIDVPSQTGEVGRTTTGPTRPHTCRETLGWRIILDCVPCLLDTRAGLGTGGPGGPAPLCWVHSEQPPRVGWAPVTLQAGLGGLAVLGLGAAPPPQFTAACSRGVPVLFHPIDCSHPGPKPVQAPCEVQLGTAMSL